MASTIAGARNCVPFLRIVNDTTAEGATTATPLLLGSPAWNLTARGSGNLTKEKLWGLDDPLFPASKVESVEGKGFCVTGLGRKHWSTATSIRAIFKQRFIAAGLPYYNPHSLRKTLTRMGEKMCRTPEEFKAWSQNLGHEQVATTFNSYGNIPPYRQAELIAGLGRIAPSR